MRFCTRTSSQWACCAPQSNSRKEEQKTDQECSRQKAFCIILLEAIQGHFHSNIFLKNDSLRPVYNQREVTGIQGVERRCRSHQRASYIYQKYFLCVTYRHRTKYQIKAELWVMAGISIEANVCKLLSSHSSINLNSRAIKLLERHISIICWNGF